MILKSWHWGLVASSQRMTWTAFANLAMFATGPSRAGQQKILNVRSIFDGIFSLGRGLVVQGVQFHFWLCAPGSTGVSHVVHIQLVLLFQSLDQDGGVLLRDCGVLVEGGGQAHIGGTTGALCCLQCPRCYHWLAKRAVEGYDCHNTRAEHTSLRN